MTADLQRELKGRGLKRRLFWLALIVLVIQAGVYAFSYFYLVSYSVALPNLPLATTTVPNAYQANSTVLFLTQGVIIRTLGYSAEFGFHSSSAIPFMLISPFPFSLVPFFHKPPGSPLFFSIPLWLTAAPFAIIAFCLRRFRREIPPGYCHECGFDLFRNRSGHCPECGVETAVDVATRETTCLDRLACHHCRTAVKSESTPECHECGTELNVDELIRQAFHLDSPVRPFAKPCRSKFARALRMLYAALRPTSFWKRLILDPPVTFGSLLPTWIIATIINLAIAWLILRSYKVLPSSSCFLSIMTIAAALPIACCFCVDLLRNTAYRGKVSGTQVAMCYAYTLPFAGIALAVLVVLQDQMYRSAYAAIGSIVAPLAFWTIALSVAFRTFSPTRGMLNAMLMTHAVVPFGFVVMLFGLAVSK